MAPTAFLLKEGEDVILLKESLIFPLAPGGWPVVPGAFSHRGLAGPDGHTAVPGAGVMASPCHLTTDSLATATLVVVMMLLQL